MAISNLITPTLDEITDLAVAFYANLLPEDDISRASDQWKRTRAVCMLLRDAHESLRVVERDGLPDRAIKVALDRWGFILEAPRKGATVAFGELRVRGAVGTAVLTSYTLNHKNGTRYQIAEFDTIGAGGFVDVEIVSISVGSSARLASVPPQTLAFEAAYPGLETNASLLADMTGGEDEEQDGPYRERLLAILRRPGLGGTEADWIRWGLAVASVASVYVYPNRNGLGTTDIAAFHAASGALRALTGGELAVLAAAFQVRRPVVMVPRVLTTVPQDAEVQVLIDPLPDMSLRPDWIDPGGLTVSAWNATTRVLKLSATRPVSMAPGARVVVKAGDGEVVTIESLGPASDEIKIATPIPSGWAPAAADPVYAGGPLTSAVRDALIAWIDGLGPSVGDFGTGWKGALYLSDVDHVVQGIEGVLDVEVQTIAGSAFATIEPTEFLYPDDDQVGYLVHGMILVRYA